MKSILRRLGAMSTPDDVPMIGEDHIDFLRICGFATECINFTEEENAHFDLCRVCRLRLIDALNNLSSQAERERVIMPKAA
jgi:hypothetical protein